MGTARPCNVPSQTMAVLSRCVTPCGWVQRELSCREFSWWRQLTVVTGPAGGCSGGWDVAGEGVRALTGLSSGGLSPDLRVSATDRAELSWPLPPEGSVCFWGLPTFEGSFRVCKGSVPTPASLLGALGPVSSHCLSSGSRFCAASPSPSHTAPGSAPLGVFGVGRGTRGHFSPSFGILA